MLKEKFTERQKIKMEPKKKLYTVSVKYEATIPVGTVIAENEEEAQALGEQISLGGIGMCDECQKIFGEGDIDEVEVEEVEPDKIIAPVIESPDLPHIIDISNVEEENLSNAEVVITPKIVTSESFVYAGTKRSFKVIEAIPLNKEDSDLPEHIKPYIMTEEELEKYNKEKEKENNTPYYRHNDYEDFGYMD